MMTGIDDIAAIIDDGARFAREIDQFEARNPLSLDEAYLIQAAMIHRRVNRGEQRVGVKMGFTSRAKMIQMGVDDVIWGRLTDKMRVEDGGMLSLSKFIHPRAEPEIAFLLKDSLESGMAAADVFAAVEAVAPALEIIDSRYRNFKFTIKEVVADNASAASFVTGPWSDPKRDVSNLGLIMSLNGRPVQIGSTAAILGAPLRALAAAARLSAAAGEPLQRGSIIMAGAATAAEWLSAGQYVRLEMEALGSVGFHVGH